MEENRSLLDMGIDQDGMTQITETSRWAKLMAILILVGVGLVALLFVFNWGLFVDSFSMGDGSVETGFVVGYVVTVLVLVTGTVVLMSFLIKGANRMRLGLQRKDQMLFNSGLANIKNYFLMYGIIVLVGTGFRLLFLLVR